MNANRYLRRCAKIEPCVEQHYKYDYYIKCIITVNYVGKELKCRKCGNELTEGYTFIRTEDPCRPTVNIYGLVCNNCKKLLFPRERKKELEAILIDNPYGQKYILDGKHYHNYSMMEKKRQQELEKKRKAEKINALFAQFPSSIMYIQSINSNKQEVSFLIVRDATDAGERNYLCPQDYQARELLAACFEEDKNHIATLQGEEYLISDKQYHIPKSEKSQWRYNKSPQSYFIPELEISSGGGYARHIKNPHFQQITDVLLYSPYTKRYEIARATLESNLQGSKTRLYMDISIFRDFVQKYGNPGRSRFYFQESDRFGNGLDWESMADESMLKAFGYTVNQTDGLTAAYRQSILAEIIDLGFMPQNKVVNHLEFCISTHSAARYINACSKWEADKKFVMSYNANPERFLIPESIIKVR